MDDAVGFEPSILVAQESIHRVSISEVKYFLMCLYITQANATHILMHLHVNVDSMQVEKLPHTDLPK